MGHPVVIAIAVMPAPVEQSVVWVERFAKPVTTSRTMMGIASLNPSYEVVPT
jgi:hypothetical protein